MPARALATISAPAPISYDPPLKRRLPDYAREVLAALLLTAVMIAGAHFLPPGLAGGLLVLVLGIFALRRIVFQWPTALTILVVFIMLVPIRRYSLPIPLPFALEPYRAFLVLCIVLMMLSLLIDRKPPWRPAAFGWPIAIYIVALWISVVANGQNLVSSGLAMRSALALLEAAFQLSVFFIARLILDSEERVVKMLQLMVWLAALVGVFAVVERATGWNIFLSWGNVLPLELIQEGNETVRAGGARSYGSSQHPIALSVALAMMLPIALYLGKFSRWPRNEISRMIVYSLVCVALLAGIVVTVARTSVVVIGVMLLVAAIFRPRLGLLVAMVGVPVFLLGALLFPDVYDETVWAFFNVDELISSQYTSPGWRGAGRLADLEPAFRIIAADPYFGTGHGSRITVGPDANAFILDNQFLATFMEAGAVGVIGITVLFGVPIILMLRFAFSARVAPRLASLAFAIAVASIGYMAAMFFYDAFAFMQTFMMQMLLFAAGAWVITESPLLPPKPTEDPSVSERVKLRPGVAVAG